MHNIAVFASGNGTNFENIARHFATVTDIRVALLVCNHTDAPVMQRAARMGVPQVVMTRGELNDGHTATNTLDTYAVDFIVLAGFLLMIPAALIKQYDKKIINIHPSLLPRHGGKGMYGMHVHEAVKAAGDNITGITIHYVNETCDGGDIIFQASTGVDNADTPEDIARKVHVLEQKYYPDIIERTVRAAERTFIGQH